MNSKIDEFLDEVDSWKYRVHEQLKDLSVKERAAFWADVRRKAQRLQLSFAQPARRARRRTRARRTG